MNEIKLMVVDWIPKNKVIVVGSNMQIIKFKNMENKMVNEKLEIDEVAFESISFEEENNRIFVDEAGKEYTRKQLVKMYPFCDELARWTSGPRDGSSFMVGKFVEVGKKYIYNAKKKI